MKHAASLILALGFTTLLVAQEAAGKSLEDFERTGEFSECLPHGRYRYDALDSTRFLFRVGAGDFFLNEATDPCEKAESKSFVTVLEKTGTKICSGVSVWVTDRDSGGVISSCRLGAFERLVLKPKSDEQKSD
ncbi:MAG: hypothetical protein AAB227_03500 [Pseudomonadota bacterium]